MKEFYFPKIFLNFLSKKKVPSTLMNNNNNFSSFLEDIEFDEQIDYMDKLLGKEPKPPEKPPIEYMSYYIPPNTLPLHLCLYPYLIQFMHDIAIVKLAMVSKETMSIVRPLLDKRTETGRSKRVFYDVYMVYVTPCPASNGKEEKIEYNSMTIRDEEYKAMAEIGFHMYKKDEVRLINLEKPKKAPWTPDEFNKENVKFTKRKSFSKSRRDNKRKLEKEQSIMFDFSWEDFDWSELYE